MQVSTLVYWLGDNAEDILTLFNLEAEELKKYDTVKGKFESYCEKRRNTIYEQDGDSDLTGDSGDEFLGTVNADTVSANKPWTAVLQLNNRTI